MGTWVLNTSFSKCYRKFPIYLKITRRKEGTKKERRERRRKTWKEGEREGRITNF